MTAYDMRISDWSSDVCSSDLVAPVVGELLQGAGILDAFRDHRQAEVMRHVDDSLRDHLRIARRRQIGDEGAIDLQLGEGQTMQLPQRGVSGPEIVERQIEALQTDSSEQRRVGKEGVSTCKT